MALKAVTSNTVHNAQPNAPQTQVQGDGTAKASPLSAPFIRGAKKQWLQGATQNLASAAWAGGSTQQFLIPTNGWLSELFLTVTGSGGVKGSATSVAPSADAPWDVFQQILISDANGTPMWNLPGYSSFLARLLGGYSPFRPDQSNFGYTPVDGTSGGGGGTGNFKAKFEFPVEFGQDGLGCLPNMDASAQYRIDLTYADPTKFYAANSTPGTNPSLAALLELKYRGNPQGTDIYGNPQDVLPPANGTVQYWTRQVFNLVNGQNTCQLTRCGNIIRNHILVFRDSNGSRSGADSSGVTPTVLQMDWDATIRFKMNTDTLRQRNYETYGFDVPAGVIALPNTADPDGLAGFEDGNEWIPTVASTLLQFEFTSSAAGTLEVITNDLVAASGAIWTAPMKAIM